ncbi:hypothetical protein HDU96_010423, partial [Phlyctochytrium bullatum]
IHEGNMLGFMITPLAYAATLGDLHTVRLLCERGTDIDCRDDDQETPLIKAAKRGWIHVVQFLVEQGADVAAKDMRDMTALGWASLYRRTGVAEFLQA